MSDRLNWSRFLVLMVALTVVSAFAIAAVGPKFYPALFEAEAASAGSPAESATGAEPVTIGTCDTAGPIEVESSGGTTVPTAYGTLKLAFDAIIAGTHTGSINIEVCGNTTETATAALTASGVGTASYTSVTIRPVGGARIIEGSIVGAIIRLNGADNVTIDGRQSGAGTARDLTVRNNNTSAATAAIWLSSVAAGNGASNNVVRNLEIAGGTDSSSSSTSASFGIIMSGTTISATSNGVDNDNNQFLFNRVIKARYGIVTRGTTTDLNINPVVSDNIVGPSAFGTDQIGKTGIYMQADTGAVVSRNVVQFVGCLDPQACTGADRMGIAIGDESWSTAPGTLTSNTYTVTKNIVHDVVEELTFSAVGIRLGTTGGGSATNNVVANNFIYNVRANGTGGDQAVGLGISGGHTDRVVFNSIAMTGDVDPGVTAASTNYGSGIRLGAASGATHANLTLMNNSVYMDLTSSSTAALRFYAISGPSNAYSFGTGGENYNNYYINPVNTQLQTGGLGTASGSTLTTQFATLANWQAAYAPPQDANSIQADPQYVSPIADLHIAMASPNVNAGTNIPGIFDDIDGQLRVAAPDIGADEPAGVTPAANDMSATSLVSPANGGAVGTGVPFAPQASFTNTGTSTQTSVPVRYRVINGAMMEVCNVTASIPTINPGQTVTVTFPTCTIAAVGTYTIRANAELAGDANTANDEITGTITAVAPLSGSYNVGAGETFTSLTNPGGIFETLNAAGATAPVTINIISDLTGETGAIPLNQFGGGFALTIQPSGGAARLISGNNANALLDFSGADGVTIDGLNTGGNSLTIRSTGTGSAIRFINDASGNTVTRTTLEANASSSVVFISTGVTTGNDNNSIVGNTITGRSDAAGAPFNSINLIGTSAAISNSNTLINNNQIVNFQQAGIVVGTSDNVTFTNNDISQNVSRTTALFGVAVNSAAGTNLFSGNTIHDLTTTLATTGMAFNDARDTTVSRNRIYNFPSTTGSTGVLSGILSNGSSGNPASLTVVNNSVSIIPAFANAQNIFGIRDFGFAGNTFSAYYNTVLIGGTGSGTSNTWACQRGFSAPTAFTMVNNICFNNRTGGTGNHFAAGDQSSNTGTFVSNYNIFVGTGATAANFFDEATSSTSVPVDFANWQAGPPARDANSQASNPNVGNYTVANMFVSPTDLHLANEATNPASNAGTPVMGITTDFDGNTRSATTPEIGFDEFFVAVPGTLAFSSATYTIGEAGGTVTLTINRTGGTDGAVNVDYALGGGTATGGAACGGSVDYVNTGGTVMFANGEASKTFNVTICNDTVFEGNETFNATLSNATGGATIGSPNPATVTITDDKGQPTVQFSSATYTTVELLNAPEGTVGAPITVTLSGPSQSTVTVDYATVAGGTATGGVSCTAGVDYLNTSGTLTFNPGEVSKLFSVVTCPDTTDEPDETVNLALTNPVGATLGTPSTAVLTITDNDAPASPVTVTATAGTPGPTPYNTLKEAIDAINAGTHQGDVTVTINSNTTETATSVLNSGDAAPASYTSVLIRPSADGVTVAGPSVQGRGLIELNGADNVTIDGDNPGTGGTNRNLTIQNTAANTVTFTSVIRIALAATVVNTANNNTIRNLNLLGSATGRNVSTATTTTGTENTTFGIFAGPGASTVSPTTAPAAVASVLTGVGAGATANNLTISNNSVATAARAVSINGSATSVFPGLLINTNSIGNPTAGDPNQVTAIGITAQGSTNAAIRDNTVYVEGFVASSAAGHGINVGVNSALITGATIERNRVNRVRNNNAATWSAMGINLGGGSDHIVRNNFVSGVMNDQTAGTGGFGTTFGAYGIRIASGTGHDIYHNSVHLYGPLLGTTSTDLTAAFIMTATTQTGVDVRNNIFSNQITGGNPTGTRHVVIALPAGTSAMNLTLNNNGYFQGTDPLSRLAQVGFTFGTGEYFAANFDPTSTTPASNFRAFSSTLNAAGTNDNASFATTGPPPFVSNTDLHIPAGTPTRLESGGAPVGVVDDIDLEPRNAMTPDIGADEFAGNPAPPNDIAAGVFVVPANGSTIQTGTAFNPQASFVNNGTATQMNVLVRFRIVDSMMMEIYNQTVTIPSIAPLQVVTVSFPSVTIVNPGNYTMHASAEHPGDSNPANNSINGSFTAVNPISGTVNVGAGQTYTSLTNPGGLFQALNTAGISSDITVNITSDLTGETGAVALNQLSEAGTGGYTVTFKPSGAARSITGSSAANNGLINLNGTDRVVWDGSLSGGTDRSLTITNTQTGTSTVFWVKSASASNGANNNTLKNLVINGAATATAQTTAGILAGSGTTIGGPAEAPNNNNTVTNNWIYRVQNSIYNQGNVGLDQNWTVTNNEFGSTVEADKNRFRGMLMGNANNFVISGNLVRGVSSFAGTAAAMSGIQLAFVPTNGNVHSNRITDIKNTSATGTGAFGMQLSAAAGTLNNVIANNFISDVAAAGSATVASNGHGITINAAAPTGAYKIYHNSINLNTNQASGTTAALNLTVAVVAAGAVDLRNNILANTQTAGATRYSVYSAAPATVFSTINYNNYFTTQNVGFIGGTVRPTLTDWQTGTGQDANSRSQDPLFVSPTDLHIQPTSPMVNAGVAGTGITTDIDGQTRDMAPDIGADEIVAAGNPGVLQFSAATYTVGESAGTATITVNRTGGSDGTVTVNYATVAGGTATGGAACTAGVDYITTSGTLTFVAGDTSETFTVTICPDATDEPDETINMALTMPTGGATIGMQSTAVLTITDDDLPGGTFSISDARRFEGDSGTAMMSFTVTYVGPSTPASVQFMTKNGTATAGVDYVATSGTLFFNGGPALTSTEGGAPPQTINVPINGDLTKEANETFFINLSNPTGGATLADGQGVGIIIDEDRHYVSDFDRDLMADFSVFRPSDGTWYVLQSTNSTPRIRAFGTNGDIAVGGDYDGDTLADFAVYRPSTGEWYVTNSSNNALNVVAWGAAGDIPVQGDYDGDGKTDRATYRPSTGTWWIIRSTDGVRSATPFGISTDRPVQGDFDGDFRTDIAVYRDGTWFILRSSDGAVQIATWGNATDLPVNGDFDGDGKYDLAIYRGGVWWVLSSLTGGVSIVPYGSASDIPVPADYDADGTTDRAVFRPSTGEWFVLRSSNNTSYGVKWGVAGDQPIPASY